MSSSELCVVDRSRNRTPAWSSSSSSDAIPVRSPPVSYVYVSSVPETLQVKGRILKTRFLGAQIELLLDVGEQKHIIAHVPKGIVLASDFKEGKDVYVGITAFQVFPLN